MFWIHSSITETTLHGGRALCPWKLKQAKAPLLEASACAHWHRRRKTEEQQAVKGNNGKCRCTALCKAKRPKNDRHRTDLNLTSRTEIKSYCRQMFVNMFGHRCSKNYQTKLPKMIFWFALLCWVYLSYVFSTSEKTQKCPRPKADVPG